MQKIPLLGRHIGNFKIPRPSVSPRSQKDLGKCDHGEADGAGCFCESQVGSDERASGWVLFAPDEGCGELEGIRGAQRVSIKRVRR